MRPRSAYRPFPTNACQGQRALLPGAPVVSGEVSGASFLLQEQDGEWDAAPSRARRGCVRSSDPPLTSCELVPWATLVLQTGVGGGERSREESARSLIHKARPGGYSGKLRPRGAPRGKAGGAGRHASWTAAGTCTQGELGQRAPSVHTTRGPISTVCVCVGGGVVTGEHPRPGPPWQRSPLSSLQKFKAGGHRQPHQAHGSPPPAQQGPSGTH